MSWDPRRRIAAVSSVKLAVNASMALGQPYFADIGSPSLSPSPLRDSVHHSRASTLLSLWTCRQYLSLDVWSPRFYRLE